MSLASERETVRAMVGLFCRRRHRSESLCERCVELLEYAEQRLAKCRFADEKPACRRCHVHCYSPEMRERIVEVMRFSGPRMIFRHPVMALRHLLRSRKSTPR